MTTTVPEDGLTCVVTSWEILAIEEDLIKIRAAEWMLDKHDGQRVREEVDATLHCRHVGNVARYLEEFFVSMLAAHYPKRTRKIIQFDLTEFPSITITLSQLGKPWDARTEFDKAVRKEYFRYDREKEVPCIIWNRNLAMGNQFKLTTLQDPPQPVE